MNRKLTPALNLDPDDPAVARRVRSRRLRFLTWTAAVTGLGLFIVAPVFYFVRRRGLVEPSSPPPGWLMVLGGILIVASFLIGVGAVVYAVRTGRMRRNRRSPLWVLTASQRRALTAQVMRNTMEPGTDPAALRLAATNMTGQGWLVWLMAALAMLTMGQALVDPTILAFVVAALLMVMSVVATVSTIRQSTRAQVFLRDHPST